MIALLLCAVLGADEFLIDDFIFRWTVVETRDNSLKVIKNGRATLIQLGDDADDTTVVMRPSEAAAIGKVLKESDEHLKKLAAKKTPKPSEEVHAGRWVVVYQKAGDKTIIGIADWKVENGPSAVLSRDEANELAPHLLKSVEMAKFVDEKIKP